MKTITTITLMLSMIVMHQFASAQNCPSGKVRISKGYKGACGCHCEKKCVLPGEVQSYLDSGWYTGECVNVGKFCCGNWVRVDEGENVSETSLTEIYPNPSSGLVNVTFNVLEQTEVTIQVLDITGRQITTLIHDVIEGGSGEVTWDAGTVNPGIYFLVMKAGDYSETKKISVVD